ncbi:hypothetical protein T484DRAFT_1790858 [Baffinella frigidus]|nr:hypothetical protein T484DRAFT_1790858 [Cryptophyta sp. CCMP2293]
MAGHLPLHRLCESETLSVHSVAICAALLELDPWTATCTVGEPPRDKNKRAIPQFANTALHLVCRAVPHSRHSLALCEMLIEANSSALTQKGVSENGEEEVHGDEPLLDLVRQDLYSTVTSEIAQLLVSHCPSLVLDALAPAVWLGFMIMPMWIASTYSPGFNDFTLVTHCPSHVLGALAVLNQKVYRPAGDEEAQMLALRVVISLAFHFGETEDEEAQMLALCVVVSLASETTTNAFHFGDTVAEFILLDIDAAAGPRNVLVFRKVVNEIGLSASNPLHHMLRAAKLYKILADKAQGSALVARLESLSGGCLECAVSMVDALPNEVTI